jgi:hypothetical protein
MTPSFLGRLALLGLTVALVHCGAYMDVDDAPRTALQAGAPPRIVSADDPPALHVQGSTVWPMQTDVHPAVVNMPESAETSIDSVAQYLAAREHDPLMLAKALHDWIADRVTYEDATSPAPTAGWTDTNDGPSESLAQSPLHPPDPERTMRTRKGNSADQAALFVALAKHANNPELEVRYVTGQARSFSRDGEEYGYHAWNVVHCKGQPYMVDVSWDAGSGDGATYRRAYRTEYLFTPPDIFAKTHFPDWPEDQHTSHLMTRAEFDAQPLVDPRFYSLALSLDQAPARAKDDVELVVDDPYGVKVAAEILPVIDGPHDTSWVTPHPCEVQQGRKIVADCRLPHAGKYTVMVFAKTGTTRVDEVAAFEVSSDS